MASLPAGAGSLLGKRLGKYDILALLALGGTAEIYLARIGGAAGFEKYVVVKCLHDHLADDVEFVKMFLDEARLAAHLDHSNVVQTFELGEYENRYYMVMEFLAGLSLAMIVRRAGERLPGGRMPVPLVLNMVAQACAGLHYAHEKTNNGRVLNIVHRDISPQNLVVSFEGVVKVVDFGIAKAEHRETRTRSGTIKGKFAYMSPEQCVANDVDRRTDVFALGVIAHELLTGRRLFKRPSPYETYQSVIECNVQPPSSVNHELDPTIDALIMKSVAKDKEKRYPTAEAFGDALQSYLHHRGKGSGPGDIGRFLDEKFAQEIDENGQRMRELIAGRIADPGNWDEEEDDRIKANKAAAAAASQGGFGEDDPGNQTVDVRSRKKRESEGPPPESGEKSMVLETNDLEEVRASEASLEGVISDLHRGGTGGRGLGPNARTMAMNPGDYSRDGSGGGSGDVSGDASGDASGDDDMQADRTRIESNPLDLERLAAADLSGQVPRLPAPPSTTPRRTTESVDVVMAAAAKKFPDAANLPTMVAEPDEDDDDASGDGATRAEPPMDMRVSRDFSRPHGEPANVQLSRSMQHAAQPAPTSDRMATAQPRASAPQVLQANEPPQQFATQALTQALSPSQPMEGPPMPADSMPAVLQGAPVDPLNVMSPVGATYPAMDWAQAAAVPIRVVPPWMLAVLFVGAIGVALTVTIIIAHIIR